MYFSISSPTLFLASGPPTGSKGTPLRGLPTAGRSPHACLLLKTLVQIALERIDCDSILQHAIAMTNGNLMIFQRLMIDGDAKWRPNFILARVAFTDIAA